MTKDFIFLWLVFSGLLLGLSLLIAAYILLSRFFTWLRFNKNLKFVKNNLLNKVVEERSMPVGAILRQEDTKDAVDEFSQEIEKFRNELMGDQSKYIGNRVFFQPDQIDLRSTVEDILDQHHYVQDTDLQNLSKKVDHSMVDLSLDIGVLKTNVYAHTQQFQDITAKLDDIKDTIAKSDKQIRDIVYEELKTFSVQLKSTVDEYIDKKVDTVVQNKADAFEKKPQVHQPDLGLLKLQQSLYRIQQQLQEKPSSDQQLQHTLLRQKMNFMFTVLILCFIITLLVGVYFFKFIQ